MSGTSTRRGHLLHLLALLTAPFGTVTAPFGVVTARGATEPQRWVCTYNECDPYVYDPLHGDPDNIAGSHPIPPGVAFEDLPDDWRCPVCGSPKQWFEPTDRAWKPPT